MRRTYRVDFRCTCGHVPVMIPELILESGPTRGGTAAELWPDGDYPHPLASELRCFVWCDQAGGYVRASGPERMVFVPWGEFV